MTRRSTACRMWNSETNVRGAQHQASGSWAEMREHAARAILTAPSAERPTLLSLLKDAAPERPWSCFGQDISLRIWDDTPLPPSKDDTMSTLPEDHTNRDHAALGASSCYRWWNCPGSLNLENALKPPKRTTPDAEKGTAAHEVAHACLLSQQDAIEWVDRTVNNVLVDDVMAYNVQVYLDLCRGYIRPGFECFTEKKFNLKKLGPPAPMFGTSDFGAVCAADRRLIIVDYKNGYLPVEAQGNPQLKYYALGVICSLPETVKIDTIEVWIVQPNGRGEKTKRAEYKLHEIFMWHMELLEHARATQDINAPLKAGSWCKFCPNAGMCPTQAAANMEVAQLEFAADVPPGQPVVVHFNPPGAKGLSPEQIDALLMRVEEVEGFIASLKSTAQALIEHGTQMANWKVVQGLGHRIWADPEEAAKRLTASYGLSEDAIWEKKLISPATVEKHLRPKLRELGVKGKSADEMLAKSLGSLVRRPLTAPRLAPSTDPLPALPTRGEEFTAELPGENVSTDPVPSFFD